MPWSSWDATGDVQQVDNKALFEFDINGFICVRNVLDAATVERRVVIPAKEGGNAVYGDAPLGLYVVRGDSIVLLGEVDDAREASPQHPARMDIRDVLELERAGLAERAVVWDIEES